MAARSSTSLPSRMGPNPLESLPAEIFLEVSGYLASRADVLQLSQVSKTVYGKVLPALYADVDLHGAEQCERTLAMIERCPQVARHVRKLTVHPEHEFHPRPHDQYRAWDNAGVVSRCVMRAARNLDALHHFEWDGEDMLPDDRMWAELRSRCPCLKSIGTTFGCFLPRPTSNLFKFDDLRGFALTLKDGFYAHSLHVPSRGGSSPLALKDGPRVLLLGPAAHADADDATAPESEPVFARLWDMLTIRCPNLESLALVGHSSEPSEAARLYAARWPKLRHLALGALVWSSNTPGQAASQQRAPEFKDFLEAHPSIQSLHLLGRPSSNQLDLSGLDHAALPNLKEFSGSFVHLRMLVDRTPSNDETNANTPPPVVGTSLTKTLKRVCFPHAMHLRDLTPVTISRVLLSLHALTSLKVTFAIQGGYDSNNILRTIATSCPFLHDLDITCTNKSSFFLETFANSLRGLSRLRTLALTLVRTSGEEPMHVGAARIARANPRLRAFAITFIPPHTAAAAGDAPPPPLERGAFELTCDAHGIPVCLHVAQWHAAPWPWPWLGAWSGASSLVLPFPLSLRLTRTADAFVGAGGLAEWFAAVASALGIETPLALLEHRALTLGNGGVAAVPGAGVAIGVGVGVGIGAGPGIGEAAAEALATIPAALGGGWWGAARGRRRGSVRRWVYDLRPSGHPDVQPKGMGALLLERGPAGEEARLMVFCLCLLVLTFWALVGRALRGEM